MNIFLRSVGVASISILVFVFHTPMASGQNLPSFDSSLLFKDDVPRAETTVRIASWDSNNHMGIIAVHYKYPEGYHQIDDPDFFTVHPHPVPGVVFGAPLKAQAVYKDGFSEYFDETTILIEFTTSDDFEPTTLVINALFQICDEDGICLFPDSELHNLPFNPDLQIMADATVLAILKYNNPDSARPVSMQSSISLWLFLLMALIGGILLNVMPCILPLLSIKALGLMRQAHSNPRTILLYSWLYVAGILVSFWILAIIVILLQSSGHLLGWGFQFQSPTFVLLMVAILWVFALSMFDVFVIEAPQRGIQKSAAAGTRGGYIGSFLTGMFAVLVATPCTAPFLGPALGFAFSQKPTIIIAVFSMVGIGLGLPFLLLGLWPGSIKRFPKPGAWMNTFKQLMGFFLLGTTVYLFTTFMQLAPNSVSGALWWLFFLTLSAWLLGKARQPSSKRWFRILGQTMALSIAIATGLLLLDLSQETSSTRLLTTKDTAITFEEADVLSRIANAEPIFLEFTASWCTTCKVNQRVLNAPLVQSLMQEKGVTHIIGDLTAYDATITRWLAQFNRAGVPLYVLYKPGDEPYVFPEFLTIDSVVLQLEHIEN